MDVCTLSEPLPGHEDCGTLQIVYSINKGIQVCEEVTSALCLHWWVGPGGQKKLEAGVGGIYFPRLIFLHSSALFESEV